MEKISIIIPTVNSPWMEKLLTQVYQQIDASIEVIVVGLDKTGYLKTVPWLNFIDTHQKIWPATARNLGIKKATGDILCFIDDDCIPQANWLNNLLTAHQQGQKIVGGGVIFPTHNYWTVCDNLIYFADVLAETSSGTRNYLPSLNLSIHRTIFEQVGLFDETFRYGEDTELCFRIKQAGYGLWFAPKATILHLAHRNSAYEIWHRSWLSGQAIALNVSMQNLLHPAPIFRHWFGITLTSIPRATIATYQTFKRYPTLSPYRRFAWGIWLGKFAWQLGAAYALYGQSQIANSY